MQNIFFFKLLLSLCCVLGWGLAVQLYTRGGISSKTYASCFKEPKERKNVPIIMNISHYNNNTHLPKGTLSKVPPYIWFSATYEDSPNKPKLSAVLQSGSYIIYPRGAIRYFYSYEHAALVPVGSLSSEVSGYESLWSFKPILEIAINMKRDLFILLLWLTLCILCKVLKKIPQLYLTFPA